MKKATVTNVTTSEAKKARNRRRNQARRLKRRELVQTVGTRLVGSGVMPRDIATRTGNIKRGQEYGVLPAGNLSTLGLTAAGRGAALKALHPAAELGAFQWPDRNTADTCVMENLDVIDIPPPINQPGNPMEAWNINIYLMPFPDCVALMVRWWEGAPVPDINHDVKYENVKVTGDEALWSTNWTMIYSPPWSKLGTYPGNYYQQIRLTARSATVDLVAAGLYDQGTVYGGQFGADIEALPLAPAKITADVMNRVRGLLRQFAEEGKIDMDASEFDATVGEEMDAPGPPVDATGNFTVYQTMPNTFQQLAQLDKKYYQGDARDGVYIPLKHAATNELHLEACAQQYHLCPLEPTQANPRWGHHVMFGNSWQVGVVMFRNILKQGTLNAKFISDIEATPLTDAITAKFARPAPRLDQLAIDQTNELMARMKSAYPSAANSLGTILNEIGGWLSRSGIPVLSQIGKLTQTDLGKKVTGMLDNIL